MQSATVFESRASVAAPPVRLGWLPRIASAFISAFAAATHVRSDLEAASPSRQREIGQAWLRREH
jgi:hypothetical protein